MGTPHGLDRFDTPPDNKEQPSELTPCNSRERIYEGGAPLERHANHSPTREEIRRALPRVLSPQLLFEPNEVNPHGVLRWSARPGPPVGARERRSNPTSSSSSAVGFPAAFSRFDVPSSFPLYSAASQLASLRHNGESPPPLEDVPEPYNPRRPPLTEASLLGNMNGGDSSHMRPDYTLRRHLPWVSGLGAGGDEGEEEISTIPNRPITTEGLTSAFNGLPRRDPVLAPHPYLAHMRSRQSPQRRSPAVEVGPPLENRALESPLEPHSLSEDESSDDAHAPIRLHFSAPSRILGSGEGLGGFDSEILSPTEVMEGISLETMQATSRQISSIPLQNSFSLNSGIHGIHWNGTPDDDSDTDLWEERPLRPSATSDVTPTAEHIEHRDQTPEVLDRAEYNGLRPVYGAIIWCWARALARGNEAFFGPVPLDGISQELFDDLIFEDLNRMERAVRRITHLINLYRNQWSSTPETQGNLDIGARFREVLYRDGLQRERSLWEDCIGFHLDREPGVGYQATIQANNQNNNSVY
jgi:hypothetical protein